MTLPGSNGGIFIDTDYLDTGWPAKGFEVQVKSPKTTSGLPSTSSITIKVSDKLVTQWTQPAGWAGTEGFPVRRIAAGTITLQGHDPASTISYKNTRIKPMKES